MGDDHHLVDGWQGGGHRRDFVKHVQFPAVVVITFHRDEHLWRNLAEAVEHPLNPEIGRAT